MGQLLLAECMDGEINESARFGRQQFLTGEVERDRPQIDMPFAMKMTTEIHYMRLVNSIIHLAHGLNLKVVAEGVETKEETQLLKLLRCEQAQGYLYSKPLTAEAFAAKL